MKIRSLVAATALLISVIAERPASAAPDSPIPFISGGVSVDGMQEMTSQEGGYNLKLLLVQSGQYLANVNVTITNSKGENLLNTITEGPVLLVKLPAGHYTASTSTEDGVTLDQQVTLSDDRLASYILRYPAKN